MLTRPLFRRVIFLGLGALLTGCAATSDWRIARPDPAPQVAQCLRTLAHFDAVVEEAGVGDAGAVRVAGFPYLRADRFLASFASEPLPTAAYRDWLAQMRELDREARLVEAGNLPEPARRELTAELGEDPAEVVNACGDRLLRDESMGYQGELAKRLRRAVRVPDHYLEWRRALGVYPLTRIGLAAGFERWQEEHLRDFGRPFSAMSARAPWVTYAPRVPGDLDAEAAARLVREAPRGALGTLELSSPALLALAGFHAPRFEIETRGNDDRPGSPYWRPAPGGVRPAVDSSRPVADVRLAYTRFEGEVLPQLVYTLWFPARTRRSGWDMLGGRLDGIVWRVTLDAEGHPLIHDSIHPCGCYHLFFPVPPLRRVPVPADDGLREAPLTPAAAPRLAPGQRLLVRLATTSHYVRNLAAATRGAPGDQRYELRLVDAPPRFGQRSLPLPGGGRRSLYGPQGLVPHTERLERWVLWPAGILSPGAMRQWGTQATAFVGRRHFDDPYLFEAAFERLPAREPGSPGD